ncbi:MAG: ComEA family DNA-binding protein [Candidatus Nanopelagicales bacterium]
MWGFLRGRRSQVARTRLAALSPGWLPTPQLVQQTLARLDEQAAPQTAKAEFSPPATMATQEPPTAVRMRMERPAAHALILLSIGGVVGALVLALLAWPRGGEVAGNIGPPIISGTSNVSPIIGSATPTPSASVVVVDVAGLVRHPGVVELATGGRVIDALEAAGGVRRRGDTSALNLAQVLVDGEQVMVPSSQQLVVPPVGVSPSSGASATGLVSINTASLEELDTLPGIGPVLAQAIIDWRTQNGPFTSVEQLQEVSGIGTATFADLQPLVRV